MSRPRFYAIVIACFCMVAFPTIAGAVSYPLSDEHRQLQEYGTAKRGAIVYLFHSGTPDVKEAIKINDILMVYGDRYGKLTEVGKIRINSYIGSEYLSGEVLEGEVKHDDVARKGGVSCLIILKKEMIK